MVSPLIICVLVIGGIEGGITVDSIPDEAQGAPIGYYKYVDGAFVVNADYVAPSATAEPTQSDLQILNLGCGGGDNNMTYITCKKVITNQKVAGTLDVASMTEKLDVFFLLANRITAY